MDYYKSPHGTPKELDNLVKDLLAKGYQPKGHQKLWNNELVQVMILSKKTKVIDYKTAFGNSPEEVDKQVNKALKKGFELHSNSKVVNGKIYCQSLIKKKKVAKPTSFHLPSPPH